ncbi:MAG: sigma-70 family RNA polymerase sigma factor [Sporocytophaga sp.]|uniref:RNA polymerase sigma factor n=1 Tax=Sporocytophaga sp. TaxID=2231183 RepID=UPI001B1702C2|nr:sigma-70 family RNA polymerase sigma factor [Sporocytophaga sp.]MBO9702390.1 sigma-70 family RNA polymerase sigma factor [Sporocytophaga sp.]
MENYKEVNQEEEKAIIEKAKKDPEQFGILYNRYYKPVYIFIHKRTNDKECSADIASHVFLKALTNLKNYIHQGFPFSSWLYKIALNEVNEYYRKKNKRRVVSIEITGLERLTDALIEGESDLELNEKRFHLSEALKQLDALEIQLIELRFFEEKSFKEVGYILNITENNAKVKTYRLLDKIKAAVLLNYR